VHRRYSSHALKLLRFYNDNSHHSAPDMPQRLRPEDPLMLGWEPIYAAQLLGRYFFERYLIHLRKWHDAVVLKLRRKHYNGCAQLL
jgi:hypothetical protein